MQMELPTGNPVHVTKWESNHEDFAPYIKGLHEAGFMGIFKCVANAPQDLHLPVLPIKHKGKLTFPVGTFTGK
jgi:hypothetical protein